MSGTGRTGDNMAPPDLGDIYAKLLLLQLLLSCATVAMVLANARTQNMSL